MTTLKVTEGDRSWGSTTIDITHSHWIFRHFSLEGRQITNIFIVQPLHFEVQIHIVCTFTQPVFLMLCKERKKELGLNLPLSPYQAQEHLTKHVCSMQWFCRWSTYRATKSSQDRILAAGRGSSWLTVQALESISVPLINTSICCRFFCFQSNKNRTF